MIRAAVVLALLAGSAAAGPLEDCMATGETGAAVTGCLELRVRTATGDAQAALDAATEAAMALAQATGRNEAVAALVASEAAFTTYLERECERRRAFMDAGTGAGRAELACRAELAEARAATLWSEVGGRPAAAGGEGVVGRDWQLVRIQGEPVLEGTAPTLRLAEDGSAFGDASTNRFTGGYRIDGMGLAFGPAASTMMYNDQPDGRMAQEQRYLQLLGEVDRFRLVGNELVLIADGRRVLELE